MNDGNLFWIKWKEVREGLLQAVSAQYHEEDFEKVNMLVFLSVQSLTVDILPEEIKNGPDK